MFNDVQLSKYEANHSRRDFFDFPQSLAIKPGED